MEKRLRSSLQSSAEEFLSAAAKLQLRSSKSAIKSSLNALIKPSSDLISTLPRSLHDSISRAITKFKDLSNSNFAASPLTPPAKRVRRSGRNKKDDEGDDEVQSIAEKLQVYACILYLCVFHHKDVLSVSDLLPAAQELHDNLILFEADSILLSEIANLCEEWWKVGLLGRETLITQSLPVILSRSLTLNKKVDVHRVYSLREAFSLFDFEDESIEDLKHLLIRCVISPLYLKTDEGRKFIAFLFGLSMQLTKELCAMIKSQIPFGRKSMLEAYGEIIFRGWKTMESERRNEIENGFLQELMEGAVYASSPELAASIRRILWGFVHQRTTEGVEKLIFRLAEPLVFRSLQVANSNVRQNALHILLDLFPLENPDATKEAKDTLLEKQFFLLEKLLSDECPDVRVVAVEGSCRTLHLFWEVVPSPAITKMITRIFDNMIYDACSEVRHSTVNGVIYLLDNPQSHEVLKVLLPKLGNLIMDSTSVVRAAIADLLLLLNDIRNFHFHKVVPLDVLISSLADDQPVIARKITKLLIPSYFPSKVTEEEACKRVITLIKRSPTAGARFCEFVTLEGASLGSLMRLFKIFISLSVSPVKLREEQIEGLLVAASHLCSVLAKDASLLVALKEELSVEKLKSLFEVASSTHAQSAVCNIISHTTPDAAGDLFGDCMGLITKCSGILDNTERQAEVRCAHKMIVLSGCFDDMFEDLVGLLQRAACGCHEKFGIGFEKQIRSAKRTKTRSSVKISSKSKHGKNRKPPGTDENSFLEDYALAVGVAWQIKDLLLSDNTRKAILGSRNLKGAYSALKVISEASILHSQQYDYLNTYPVSAYTTLTLHMSLCNVKTDGSKDSAQDTTSDLTLNHLFHCAYYLFKANKDKKSVKFPSGSPHNTKIPPESSTNTKECQTGASLTKMQNVNTVKALTSILKFVVDATAMDLVPHYQEWCLNFTTENLRFVIKSLRELSVALLEGGVDDLKDQIICLKSLFTYGAKLLNVVLNKSGEVLSLQRGAYNLVNELFNLTVAVEEVLGYGCAARFSTGVQPWIPDLALALGSSCLLEETRGEGYSSDSSENPTFHVPSWFHTLARTELSELEITGSDDENEKVQHPNDFSAFKSLVETMSELLSANTKILDAVGVTLLTGSLNALKDKNLDTVLGVLHFVCRKLVRVEDWKELKSMLVSLEKVYRELDTEAEKQDLSEDDMRKLYSAKTLLEPVWTSFIYEEGRNQMEEE